MNFLNPVVENEWYISKLRDIFFCKERNAYKQINKGNSGNRFAAWTTLNISEKKTYIIDPMNYQPTQH